LLDPLETKQEENEALNTNNGFCAVRQTNGTAQESVFEGYAALLSPHVRVYHKGIRRAMIGVQAHKHTRSFDKMFFEDARLVRGNVSLKEMCARLSHVFRGDPNAVRRATIGVPALRRARKKAQKKTQLAP
jgi:hypothetical protein